MELDATQGEFGMWGRGKGQQTPCPESPCQPARQKWHSLAPQSHLAWALLVMFGGVRETLLPSAPSQGTNLGADMQGGQGQIHYKYSTIVSESIGL